MRPEEKLDLLEIYIETLIQRLITIKAIGKENDIVHSLDEQIDIIKKKILEEIKL